MLVFSTPMCCAIFPQQAAIKIENLEPELQAKVDCCPDPAVCHRLLLPDT
jgi:hypothetical protein